MNKLLRPLIPLVLAASAVLPAQAEPPVPVEEFSVFVDVPTGFAFVKTPAGWHFVRQLDAPQLSRLHPTTLVSLMPAGAPVGRADLQAQSAQSML